MSNDFRGTAPGYAARLQVQGDNAASLPVRGGELCSVLRLCRRDYDPTEAQRHTARRQRDKGDNA
jgi:hypothetical protein